MAAKPTPKPTTSNSVRTKAKMAPPLAKTPSKAPTMRSTAKDITNAAKAKDKARALKAANQTPIKTKAQLEAGRVAAKRALLTPPNRRTAAQGRAASGPSGMAVRFGGGGMNWQNK